MKAAVLHLDFESSTSFIRTQTLTRPHNNAFQFRCPGLAFRGAAAAVVATPSTCTGLHYPRTTHYPSSTRFDSFESSDAQALLGGPNKFVQLPGVIGLTSSDYRY